MEKLGFCKYVFDGFLDGGLETDSITTVYGPAGSGKTTIALLAAISAASSGKKVIFVDTEGGFSITRLKQLISNHKKVLDKIVFLNPSSFEEQCKSVDKLSSLVSSKIGLIVVDTLTMLFRLERGETADFTRKLGLQIALLTAIARNKNIPVLVASQVYSSFEEKGVRVVGGDIIHYGSKCLIELQVMKDGVRRAILRKHRSLPFKEVFFDIVEDGFELVD